MLNHNEPVTLKVEGMDCANCALGITRKLSKSGHGNVYVDFATGEASLLVAENTSLSDVIHDIEGLGYRVIGDGKQKRFQISIAAKFWFCLVFTVPLFFGHMLLPHDSPLMKPAVQLLLCLPVFLTGAWFFGKSAFNSLKAGVPNMDVLIFIGAVSSFGYSIAGMLTTTDPHLVHQYMFFETTATIITLVLLGNLLEHISVKKTTTAIDELSSLQPEKAKRWINKGGVESFEDIPVADIRKGDVLLVNAGESFPADGEIISGSGTANESMITGESVPVDKKAKSPVTGGTVLLSGPVRMLVKQSGAETALMQIISMVKKAQHEKPPVQQLADKISAIFVPVVLGISVITFLLSAFIFDIPMRDALMHSIAVLVISCPCAMGLATPTAVMVGVGRAAKKGILIRGGRTLEQLAGIKTIVFDKTGTLTTGNFSNLKIQLLANITEQKAKELIFALEQNSAHPLAKSLVNLLGKEIKQSSFRFEKISEEKGIGLSATDENGDKWSLGSGKLLADSSIAIHDIYLLKNNEPVAAINLEDEIRPEMKEIITFLHAKNIRTVLLTGDRDKKAQVVASALGIKEVFSEQSPEQKLEIITRLSKENKTAMVGDGINDAPALARADVGISPGEATKVAMQSAQVVLLGTGDLSGLKDALLIGQHSLLTIKQNLFWAFFYNAVAIPIAALGFLSPMIAALSMAFSDVIVIGNSIRLRTKKLR
ncbi:MAG: cadmium-translocating P-type ATPase [Bacteroidota bacterium]|nr:cadmium-translocating P-type ATPase [Bacteroidota bacterium]